MDADGVVMTVGGADSCRPVMDSTQREFGWGLPRSTYVVVRILGRGMDHDVRSGPEALR